MNLTTRNGPRRPKHLFECFDCHRTWWERAETCRPCPMCEGRDVVKYDNERMAAREAAGLQDSI